MDKIFDVDELQEIIDKFIEKVTIANRTGNISEILAKFDIDCEQYAYCEYKIAKILVIGYSEVNIVDLKRVIKKHKLSEDRFEFVIDDASIKSYPMNSLKNNYKYSDIFIGPIPHKTTGMGANSSIIAEIKKHQDEYPKLTELRDANVLKISKCSFSKAILNSELYKKLNEV